MPRKLDRIKAEKLPQSFRLQCGGKVEIKAEAGEGKLPRFSMRAYTGVAMNLEGFSYPVVVDLEGVKGHSQQNPIFRQHDPLNIVGHSDSVGITTGKDGGIDVAGVMSGVNEHTKEIIGLQKNGFNWQASIGATPIIMEFLESGQETEVNGKQFTGPMYISRESLLGEISFVPIGADNNTSAVVLAAKKLRGSKMDKDFSAYMTKCGFSAEDQEKMNDDTKAALAKAYKASADDTDTDEEKKKADAKAKAKAADDDKKAEEDKKTEAGVKLRLKADNKAVADNEERIANIRILAQTSGIDSIKLDGKTVPLVATAIREGWDAKEVELHILRADRAPDNSGPHLHFPNNPEMSDAVIECAVIQAGRHDFRLEEDDFWKDPQTGVRRIPQYKEREVRAELKVRYPDKVQQAAHSMFRGGAGLQAILVAKARMHGYRGSDRINDGNIEDVLRAGSGYGTMRAAEGSSTASIANILANVQNKFALVGYLYVEQAWREVAAIRPTTDFKPTKSINLLGDTMVKPIPDNGQLTDASLSDQAFANQVDQYGRMLTIGRKPIINDDLQILTTTPMKMGQGAGLGLNNLFYTVFNYLTSITADDGAAFWASTGGNHTATPPAMQVAGKANLFSGGGTALSNAALQTAKQAFDNQIDPNGNPLGFDAQVPILFFPPELWVTAMELVDPAAMGLVYGGATAAKQSNINMWKGRLKPVMSRYLNKNTTDLVGGSKVTGTGSTTAWYVLFPSVAGSAVIEVAFLNGVDTPVVQTAGPDWNFDRLGISMRVVFDYGVNAQNFRAGVKMNGQ